MSTTLRVFVGEGWPEQPSTRWVLLDPAGDLLQQGESDALRWPVADYCEAVISAPEVAWLQAKVPQRASPRDLPQIVAGVLEDQLLDDPDRCHLTVCGRQGSAVEVLVVARTRLRNIVAQFVALNRPLVAVYSELQNVPLDADNWNITLAAEGAIVSRPGAVPLTVDFPEDGGVPPVLLGALMPGSGMAKVTIRPEAGKKVDLAGWKGILGTELVNVGEEYRWHIVPGNALNLLHGEFASRQKRNNWWLVVRPAVFVAAMALLAYMAVALLQLGWLTYQVNVAEGRISELFRAAFPGVPAVAPVAQTRRQLDQLRGRHGLAKSDDALTLLSALSEVMGPSGENSVRELKYADHRLTLIMDPSVASSRLEGVRRALEGKGYRASAQSSPDRPTLTIELDMAR